MILFRGILYLIIPLRALRFPRNFFYPGGFGALLWGLISRGRFGATFGDGYAPEFPVRPLDFFTFPWEFILHTQALDISGIF